MIKSSDVDAMIKKAIGRFQQPYGTTSEHIQVIFSLGADAKSVQYITCVDKEIKNSVTLKQLIGWNLYNGIVDDKMSVLLQRIRQEFPRGYMMAGMLDGKVYYHVYSDNRQFARSADSSEFLN